MFYKSGLRTAALLLVVFFSVANGVTASDSLHLKFDFGIGTTAEGYVRVTPDMPYTKDHGYGFFNDSSLVSSVINGGDALRDDFITSSAPFIFAVNVPEGNYDVIVTLGNRSGESISTIKAESRRLMFKEVTTAAGEFKEAVFTTNVRYSRIDSSESVKLKPREIGHHNWDSLLTIEFNNIRPVVCAIEIIKNNTAVSIFLAGNSTVTDQRQEPWAAWGQMLPCFFKPHSIVIANHAESGEALKSFIAEGRLKKIFTTIRKGDYLFIQFAHNDQKPQSTAYVEPFKRYRGYLKKYIDKARGAGAIPVLVTPMCRRNFDENGRMVNTHGDYPEAMHQTACEEKVALIDLNQMSAKLFEALGQQGSKKAFVHYPANTFPGQEKALADDTHFNNYGAYQLARCIVGGIREKVPALAKYLVDNLPSFDPAFPDAADDWDLPASPQF